MNIPDHGLSCSPRKGIILTACFLLVFIAPNRHHSVWSADLNSPTGARCGSGEVFGCTIVMTAKDGLVLVGNNEDRNNTETVVTFMPASEKFHGRILFGYTDAPFQGGMNDQGLFIDGNRVAPTGWRLNPDKETFSWNVMMSVLATCATREDVKKFFGRYNIPALERARFPVADRSGASMIVEFGQGEVQFVESKGWYQIATNFIISNINDHQYPCWRYRRADQMLSEAEHLNLELIRNVLDSTHQEGRALTVYSNIYDLKEGKIYLYNLRNFEEVVTLNLREELLRGERRIDLATLFGKPDTQKSID